MTTTRDDLIDSLDAFTLAYLECALWSSTDNSRDDGGDPLDENYDIDSCSEETLQGAIDDCAAFRELCAEDLAGLDDEQCGHDFWLTRNGHGTGFWDRGLGAKGQRLSAECKPFGSVELYVGDDGLVYGA